MKSQLRTTMVRRGRSAHLLVAGEVDLSTYEQFERAVAEAARSHGQILLDLTEVELMTTVGIHVLYTHRDQVKAIILAPGSILTRALSIAGLDTVIPINPD